MSKIDLTKPIEAVRKRDGKVVPVTFRKMADLTRIHGPRFEGSFYTNECPSSSESNSGWHADGSDHCGMKKWFVRNVAEAPKVDWTKPLEDSEGRPCFVVRRLPNGGAAVSFREGAPTGNHFNAAGYRAGLPLLSAPTGQLRNRQETSTMTLDLSKPLQTADGKSVRLIASNIPGAMPLLVEVTYRSAFTKPALELRAADGRVTNIPGRTSGDDVINVKPKPVLIYRNVYDDGTTGKSVHKTFNDARDRSKIGKVRIGILEIETTDGVVTNSKMFRCVPAVRTSALGNAAWNTAA